MEAERSSAKASAAPFPILLEKLCWKGKGLVRPECVLTTASGDIFSADWRGGAAHIRPDGSQAL